MREEKWLGCLIRLQALAQAGLAYGKDKFDIERFEEIRSLSVAMMADLTDLPAEQVRDVFANESGYQTPKIDTRAAIFQGQKILLVEENDGRWALPGGWCDVDQSVAENTIKEVKEEAGLDVELVRVVAIQDKDRHNQSSYAHKVCKIFSLCRVLGGHFAANLETLDSAYFELNSLPELATNKTTEEQIRLCYAASQDDHWQTQID